MLTRRARSSLNCLSRPSSIARVGASSDQTRIAKDVGKRKPGYTVIEGSKNRFTYQVTLLKKRKARSRQSWKPACTAVSASVHLPRQTGIATFCLRFSRRGASDHGLLV